MAVLDWLRTLAGGAVGAAPTSRVIVAPPDVSGGGGGGGGKQAKDAAGGGVAAPKSQAEDPADPEQEDPECDDAEGEKQEDDEDTSADAGGGDASSTSGEDDDDESNKEPSMSTIATPPKNDTTVAPVAEKAASVAELKAQFPGETDFVLDCAEKGLNLRDAKGAFADVLQERLADTTKKLEAKDSALKGLGNEGLSGRPALSLAPSGVKAPAATGGGGGWGAQTPANPTKVSPAAVKVEGETFDTYDQAVAEYQNRGLSRAQAFRQVTIDHPELHDKWRIENGAKHTKMLAEKKHRR